MVQTWITNWWNFSIFWKGMNTQWFWLIKTTRLCQFVGYSCSESNSCFKSSMARAFSGRMFKFENVIRSWWKSIFFESWFDDLFQFGHPSTESSSHVLFRTGLVFTVATTKKICCGFENFVHIVPIWSRNHCVHCVLCYQQGYLILITLLL